ncbi:MAG: PQQ-binding-like beta-propeller repeat protein [Acidobacteriota bacterium]|nr:PQQ-binding-like beta-propeller repeat protein [Acidobacteriota bacterium]
MKSIIALTFLLISLFVSNASAAWDARLDGRVRFYQTTDFGVLIVATDRSLYALDGNTGETVWRKAVGNINETAVVPVPGTDLILLSLDEGKKSRLAAIDLLSGASIWTSDKVKGDLMQLAVEPAQNLLCAVLVKNPRGQAGSILKREPEVAVFDLQNGDLLWKRNLGGEIEMMPASFNESGETAFTLDNYRAPMILDERVFLFYEGATSFEARTGREREREEFKVNVDGVALTEADPVFDDEFVYTSGRGKVRAVRRSNGEVEWEAKDLGVAPEMFIVGDVLYVRTGGQFTRIKDGEIVSKGSYGVSALDRRTGKTLWRYKGADKGLTNLVFANERTILLADKDDLISVNAKDGKRIGKFEHGVKNAQFVLLNENREAIVGGTEEIAAFNVDSIAIITDRWGENRSVASYENANFKVLSGKKDNAIWRGKYEAPGRSFLSRVGSIALRATALYFRYGGWINFGFNAVRGASLARSVLGLRWSGVRSRIGNFDLTSLATNAARNYVSDRIRTYGIASRIGDLNSIRNSSSQIGRNYPRPTITLSSPSREDIQERLLDRLDPANIANRLADWLSRRKRLAELRGNFMYFYTELPRGGRGLVGVNVINGNPQREIRLRDPDARFITDEAAGLLYSANGNRLTAYNVK